MTIKLFIDPGHGGMDPGAVGNGLKEKNLTLAIAKRVKDYLNKHYTGHSVMLSRSGDTTLSLSERTNKANAWGADYFLSIHINAGGGTGFESFIYNGTYSSKAKTNSLRNTIHQEIMSHLPGVRDRGKKEANYHVLRESYMPAMLTECLFIDTKDDTRKLSQAAFINLLAIGHAEGLAKAFKLKPRATKEKPSEGTLYKVQVGAFKEKKNAERLANELKEKGYPVYITKK